MIYWWDKPSIRKSGKVLGMGVEISIDFSLRRPPAPNTKKSHFSATNFFTCYMRIFNYLRLAITL